MSKLVRWLLKLGLLIAAGPLCAQTTQTYTGTIKDLSGAVVTSGQVSFTLTPPTISTIPGTGSFVATTINCNINADGTLSGFVGSIVSGPCILTANISLSPSGTAYRICEQPNFVSPGSCFFDYALGGTKDISSVVPTLSTGPVNFGSQALTASLSTSPSTSDVVTITGMISSGHCSLAATNALAATNLATTYISAKGTNQITVTHAATFSAMTYDIICVAR